MELEAALGACREKALELELRLKNAEERMHLQARTTSPDLCAALYRGLQVDAASGTTSGGE